MLPNYVAGARWGTQTDPIRTMQKPLSPAESALHLVLPSGFEAKLFAAEPEITKPICLAWDEKGRLWIAETVDYPNDMQPPGGGRDRIRICEDTNGDGQADRFTIFADKLSIPTSMVFANGGLIVAQAPDFLFLKDTNGDDKADVRQVLFTGWGTSDTHAGPSNLRWGFDNWIWGTVGYSGFEGTVGGKSLKFGMGIYRFKPDGSQLEFVRSSNNNTWGLGWSEDGTLFGSTANGNASMYMAVPNRFYEGVSGWTAARMETIADSQAFYPITSKVRQVDWHGKYTAGAGHALYTARSFPKNFWNKISFVCEPTGHLIGFFELEPVLADFTAHNRGTFLGSDDEWTAPIAAEVGPDGALWMIDWYNYIVQHNPVPQGFKNGRGNAYDTKLRDKHHGRIYRIISTAGTPSTQPDLAGASTEKLVAALKNDNLLWRMHAQRLLVERGDRAAVPALEALVHDKTTDAVGLTPGAQHALWTLQGLQALSPGPLLDTALQHPSAAVRRAAASVIPRTVDGLRSLLRLDVLTDPDPQVRLAALLALAEMPSTPEAGVVVQAVLQSSHNYSDRWIRHAATSAAARHLDGYLQAALSKGASDIPAECAEILRLIAGHVAQTSSVEKSINVLNQLSGSSAGVANAVLEGFAANWPAGKDPALNDESRAALKVLMENLKDRGQASLLSLAQRWGAASLFEAQASGIIARLREQLTHHSLPDDERLRQSQTLIRLADQPESVRLILGLITPQLSPAAASGLVNSLGESRNRLTAGEIVTAWNHLTPGTRRAGLALLMRRTEWVETLVAALESGSIPRADLAPEHWQQLKSKADAALSTRLVQLQNGSPTLSADRESVVKKLLPVANRKGTAERGKEVFTTSCAVCHTFNGQGGKVGPELTGIGARARTDILTEILDPNRSVEANYRMWTATTLEGDSIAGRLDAETQTTVEILDVTGQKHSLQRKELKSLEASNNSIMPVGFEALPENDLASLLDYLTDPSHAKH